MPSDGHRTADPAAAPATPPVRRPRHLLDPSDLQRSHRSSQSSTESLTNVQRWVMSVLAATTILHFAAGLVVAAVFLDESRPAPVSASSSSPPSSACSPWPPAA